MNIRLNGEYKKIRAVLRADEKENGEGRLKRFSMGVDTPILQVETDAAAVKEL
ncbi:MAG: hypothetical protein ABSB80_06440 [Methanoregula sp.]|jgi:hypothetical protein|uniref:hypothetical protein n=1 Tax=Methanoregula sp. TaxID=2052170 RepID=UPI003D0EBF62